MAEELYNEEEEILETNEEINEEEIQAVVSTAIEDAVDYMTTLSFARTCRDGRVLQW